MSSSVNQAAANQTTPHTSNPRIPPSRMLRRFPAMFIPIYLPTSSPQSAPSTAAQPLHSAMNTGATHSVGAGAVKKPTFVIPENRQLRRSKAIRHWDLDPSLTKALAIGDKPRTIAPLPKSRMLKRTTAIRHKELYKDGTDKPRL